MKINIFHRYQHVKQYKENVSLVTMALAIFMMMFKHFKTSIPPTLSFKHSSRAHVRDGFVPVEYDARRVREQLRSCDALYMRKEGVRYPHIGHDGCVQLKVIHICGHMVHQDHCKEPSLHPGAQKDGAS